MKFGFSTLGDRNIRYESAVALAREHGFDFVELRFLGGTVDLPAYFHANPVSPEEVAKSVPVLSLCASICIGFATPADILECLATLELAGFLGAPYVRIFGGGEWRDEITPEILDRAAETVRQLRAGIQGRGIKAEMLLETHGAFSSSECCLKLNGHLDQPLNILWDTHHTWKLANETPGETWAAMAPLIKHIHVKDSASLPPTAENPIHYRLTLPGAGEFPTGKVFDLLESNGFPGGVSLEWEKAWHPEMEPLPEAAAAFAKLVKARG